MKNIYTIEATIKDYETGKHDSWTSHFTAKARADKAFKALCKTYNLLEDLKYTSDTQRLASAFNGEVRTSLVYREHIADKMAERMLKFTCDGHGLS